MQRKRSRSKNKTILIELEKIARERNLDLSRLIDYETYSPTPLGYILYKTRDSSILEYRPGEILIRKVNGNSPFMDPFVQLYHEYLKKIWKPKRTDIRIGMSCTGIKPYNRSITHKMMNTYVNSLRTRCNLDIEIVSISEPMLIVPQKYEELFPLSNYDFPPKLMTPEEKLFMINKLAELLPKLLSKTKYELVFVLPRHHYHIVSEALRLMSNKYRSSSKHKYDPVSQKVKMIRYGRLAFRTLFETYKYIRNKYCKNK